MHETMTARPRWSARDILKTIGINALVLIALWMAALICVAAGTDLYKAISGFFESKDDPRALLLPYAPDHELALQIHRDMNANGRDYRPLIEWKSRPLSTPTLNVDERGLRTHNAGKANNLPDAQTIGFFGGSAMFGYGATDDATIPAMFDVLTDNFVVTNYAENGWTARQNLAQLINLAAEGEAPKVVVFYDGFNDVRNLCNRAVTDSLAGTSMERRFNALMQRGRHVEGIWNVLVAPIMDVFEGLKTTVTEQYVCADDPITAARVADAMVRTWSMARAVTESNGGRFYGFLQPNRFTGRPRVDYLPPGINPDGAHEAIMQREFDAVYALIRKKLNQTNLAWGDLTDAFDGDEPLYIDFSHVTGKGNSIVAQRMRDWIADH